MRSRTEGEIDHIADLARRRAAPMQPTAAGSQRTLPPRTDPAASIFSRLVGLRYGRSAEEVLRLGHDRACFLRGLQASSSKGCSEQRTVLRQVDDPRDRMLVFPGAHGVAHSFSRLADPVDPEFEVVGWSLPVCEVGNRPPRSVEDFARIVVDRELAELGCIRRLRIFAYCVGGALAHEVARQLGDRGVEVERIVLLDGHPSTSSLRLEPRAKLAWKIPFDLRAARNLGRIEYGVVRGQIALIHAMKRHQPARIDTELVLIRTGSRLFYGDLDAGTRSDFARRVEFERLADLGHVEVLRPGNERRLAPFVGGD